MDSLTGNHMDTEDSNATPGEPENDTFASEDEEVMDETQTDINHDAGAEKLTRDGETVLDPYVGMEFESEQATYSFYNDYAKCVGFGIRRRFIRRSTLTKEVIGRTYDCSREGKKHTNKKRVVENPRPNTRCDCKAKIKVKKKENGKWVVRGFMNEHNHELIPRSARFFRSHTIISTPEKNVIRTLSSVGVKVPQIMSTISKQSGGVKNMRFTEKDCRNLLQKEARESFSTGDAQTIYDFFEQAQNSNSGFFYDMETDEGRLRNVFWIDAKSRMAYEHFGDVITFDTTFLTNKYALKFAPFVGVNHHGQSVLLGCALLTDETIPSFVWAFKAWLAAMGGRPPSAIITDQDQAIKAAIKEVFPSTRHRFCLWHIMKKVPEKLGRVCKANPTFMYKFNKCIYDTLTEDEFEERWENLMVTFDLKKHEWLKSLYVIRKQWVPVFLKGIFFAGMSTSQRSESINSLFDGYVNRKTCLTRFVKQFNLVLQKRFNDEEKADFDGMRQSPHLKTGSPYESQIASLYTAGVFKKFQEEIVQISSCNAMGFQVEEGTEIHVVNEWLLKPNGKKGTVGYKVKWDKKNRVSCICRLFEFKGYLCRHALVVLLANGVYEIPPHYILKRWCSDAKNTVLFVEDSTELNENGEEAISKRFIDLCTCCMKFAELGSLSKEKYEAAKIYLNDGLQMLTSLNIADSHREDNEISKPDMTVSKIIVHDPPVFKLKGGQAKRIKSGVENNKTKPRTRLCSRCKQPGHNISTCKQEVDFISEKNDDHLRQMDDSSVVMLPMTHDNGKGTTVLEGQVHT